MGRRLRASHEAHKTKPKPAPVSVYMKLEPTGYGLPDAALMLWEGYSEQHVQQRTGFDPRIVRGFLNTQGLDDIVINAVRSHRR